MPRDRWAEVNPTLVRFGQGHTRAQERRILGELVSAGPDEDEV
jgi:endonuclease III